jgi:hypothetical protein
MRACLLSGLVYRLRGCGYFLGFLSRNSHLDHGLRVNLERWCHCHRDDATIAHVKYP